MVFRCKDCKDRKVGCHGSCERYKADRKEYDRLKDIEKRNKHIDSCIISLVIRNKASNKGKKYCFSNRYEYKKV